MKGGDFLPIAVVIAALGALYILRKPGGDSTPPSATSGGTGGGGGGPTNVTVYLEPGSGGNGSGGTNNPPKPVAVTFTGTDASGNAVDYIRTSTGSGPQRVPNWEPVSQTVNRLANNAVAFVDSGKATPSNFFPNVSLPLLAVATSRQLDSAEMQLTLDRYRARGWL